MWVKFRCLVSIVLFSMLISVLPAAAAERVALVIGNSAYKFATALPNPVNDATDFGEKLKTLGFEVFGGNDLDLAGMQGAVRQFADNSSGAKVMLFFYAGHGMEVNGKNYLIPVDAKLESPTALTFEVFDANIILNFMVEEKRIAVALLDACRDNPLARSFKKKSRSAVGNGLAEVKVDQVGGGGLLYGLATGPGDTAADGDGRNSPFTKALLKHIGTPGVEFEQMMKSVKRDVDTDTKGDQRPYLTSSLVDDLYLVPAAAAPPAVAAEPAQTLQPASTTSADWELVKNSKSIPVLEAFVAKHGEDALYRGLAEERLIELRPKQIAVALPIQKTTPEESTGQDEVALVPEVKADNPVATTFEEVSPQQRAIAVGKWPEGLAVGTNNSLWVAESGARQIVKLDLSAGEVAAKIPVGRLPVSMASLADGTVFAATFTDGKLWRQPASGKGKNIWQLPSRAHVFIDIAANDDAVFAIHYTDTDQRITSLSGVDGKSGKAQTSEPFVGEGRALRIADGAAWILMSNGTLAKHDLKSFDYLGGADTNYFLWSLTANSRAVFTGGKTAQTPDGKSIIARQNAKDPLTRVEKSIESNELILTMAATETHVAALGENGNVWIFDADDLRPLKHFNMGAQPRSALFHNGQLFVTTHQGNAGQGSVLIFDGLTD
jgi:Caspase domain